MADPIRYDRLYQYAQENRLDYNELCRVVRVAAAPAIKDSMRYRWLTEHAHVGECFTDAGTILEIDGCDRQVPEGFLWKPVDEAIDAAIDAVRTAGVQASVQPIGWLYDWTHWKADEHFTSFTTDEAHARKHENVRPVWSHPSGVPAAPTDHTHSDYADGFDDGKAQERERAVRVIARLLALHERQSAEDAKAEAERLLNAALGVKEDQRG